jgi:hypothetical protein
MDATRSQTVTASTTVAGARPSRAPRLPEAGERPPRISADLCVEVRTRQGPVLRPVRDLSLTGLYVAGLRAPVGHEVHLTLAFPGETPLEVRGRVVRCDDDAGVAMVFSRIGWDDMLTIARYLAPRI